MGAVNPGKRFEGKLKASMEAAGVFSMRIPDKLYISGGRVRSEETPADFVAYVSTEYALECMLIEAKACSRNRIPFDALKPHQDEALTRFDGMHGNAHGVVAVNFYDSVSLSRMDVCFMVPIEVWREYREGDMKSLSHDDCTGDKRISLCPKDGALYDMSGWIRGFADGGTVS